MYNGVRKRKNHQAKRPRAGGNRHPSQAQDGKDGCLCEGPLAGQEPPPAVHLNLLYKQKGGNKSLYFHLLVISHLVHPARARGQGDASIHRNHLFFLLFQGLRQATTHLDRLWRFHANGTKVVFHGKHLTSTDLSSSKLTKFKVRSRKNQNNFSGSTGTILRGESPPAPLRSIF